MSQLLPAVEFHRRQESTPQDPPSNHDLGREIERPKSALHSGDFRSQQTTTPISSEIPAALSTSPVAPWHRDFPRAAQRSFSRDQTEAEARTTIANAESARISRARAISQSSTSSFVFMPPTSPLVHALNNPDLDIPSRPISRVSSRSPERNNRRHTFSPQSFHYFKTADLEGSAAGSPAARHLRREGTFPYQAHQPRRSLSNINSFHTNPANLYSNSIPETPRLLSRRPSITSDSPLQHAPMVGSYEESILRGRMSTTPSRPLNFVARIGVLGKGQCKPTLRCPPHVTIPFPAVFYSYNAGNDRLSNASPSPYVGLIDLENHLQPYEETEKPKRRHRSNNRSTADNEHLDTAKESVGPVGQERRRKEKMRRRSASPKAPPGGCYRIPQQGQLQIIIKNPNKTAVKLFLVPYDLSDMEPGQKTFIRQRSYSAGPIIDMPTSCRKNLGSDRPEAALCNSEDPSDRPVLRYLIHLHICCPSKGRYFLYKSVRVVFANRVPDDKEKLRNEIQLPEPRYSTYKPSRDSAANTNSVSSASVALLNEKAMRRRSAGLTLSRSIYDSIDGISNTAPAMQPSRSDISHLIRPIPFYLHRLDTVESRPVSRDKMDIDRPSPSSSPSPQSLGFLPLTEPATTATSPPMSPIPSLDAMSEAQTDYQKWIRGENGYESMAAPPAIGEGLLARRLRGLDMQQSPTLEPQEGDEADP